MSPDEYRYCPSCGGRLRFQAIEHEPVEHPVCESCGHIVYLDPKVAAGIIPVTDEGILLLRRAIGPSRGLWVFPGGYVNRGEHVRGAAERETREEVGLQVTSGELVGIYSYTDTPIIVIVYEAARLQGTAVAGVEAVELQFFAPSDIPWTDLAFPSTRHALLDWMARHAPGAVPGGAVFYADGVW